MKTAQLFTTGMALFALNIGAQAQITSARSLTRRIAPQTGQAVPAPVPGRGGGGAPAPLFVVPVYYKKKTSQHNLQ
jgi:hypothetical protein